MNRFNQQIEEERQKYPLMKWTLAPVAEQATVFLDAMATCCLGLRDQQEIGKEDQQLLVDLVAVLFDVGESEPQQAINTRSERKY
jgi:hypothetical protein